jgi:hypothetical protein
MNFRPFGRRVLASLRAAVAGGLAGAAVTLPMQFYQIGTNHLGDLRSLLWSFVMGTCIWFGWALMIAAVGWVVACLPTIVLLRTSWLLRYRRAVIAGSAGVALLALLADIRFWRVFHDDYAFHPWMFSIYCLLLTVYASVTAAVYLRLMAASRLPQQD